MKTTEQKLLSNEEIASFCNQAAMLFQAGIPPVEGMAILQSDAQSPEGKAIFDQILTVCRQGESFHKALEATGVFPDYCLHMIALGEESGNLDVCMNSLADYYEKEDAIAGSIRDDGVCRVPLTSRQSSEPLFLYLRKYSVCDTASVSFRHQNPGWQAYYRAFSELVSSHQTLL